MVPRPTSASRGDRIVGGRPGVGAGRAHDRRRRSRRLPGLRRHAHALGHPAAREPGARGEGAPGRHARRHRPGRARVRAGHGRRARRGCASSSRAGTTTRPASTGAGDRWPSTSPASTVAWRSTSRTSFRTGRVRMVAMGMDDRAPTDAELADMKRLVCARASTRARSGSRRASPTRPRMYATDDELVELCSVMRGTGGYYTPHHRSYGRARDRRLRRLHRDRPPRRRPAPLRARPPRLPDEQGPGAGAAGHDRRARATRASTSRMDTYPYLAGVDRAAHLRAGLGAGRRPRRRRSHRFADPDAARAHPRSRSRRPAPTGSTAGPSTGRCSTISGVQLEENRRFVGTTVAEAAARPRGSARSTSSASCCADDRLGVSTITHIGNEENVRTIMAHPAHMAGSDGILVGERPHPRGWGTFPRYLGTSTSASSGS